LEVTLTKRIFSLFVLLLALGYCLTWLIPEKQADPVPAATPSVTATATATKTARMCNVTTGVDKGLVNLRTCAGTACPVLLVLKDRQTLMVIQSGAWNEVMTNAGAHGWINSNFCK